MIKPIEDYVYFVRVLEDSSEPIDIVGVKMARDVIELHAEVTRLKRLNATYVRDGYKLADAAAAVVEASANTTIGGYGIDNKLIEALRIAAGITGDNENTASV